VEVNGLENVLCENPKSVGVNLRKWDANLGRWEANLGRWEANLRSVDVNPRNVNVRIFPPLCNNYTH